MMMKKLRTAAVVAAWLGASNLVPAASWKFAVLGDGRTGGETGNTTGLHDDVNRAIAEEGVKAKVSAVIFSGDLVNGNERYGPMRQQFANWTKTWAPIYEAKIPLYLSRGNHDTSPAQDKP